MKNSFFASSNSYSGFINYFDKIFDSMQFDKIFVLKGGSGTGKSTFMKKIGAAFENKVDSIEYFFCSSDPQSLDGIILKKSHRRIAILDGTTPHERDAVIVGAIDEVVNLGASLDCSWLEAQKEKIKDLAKEKKRAYQTAYSYLKISGACNEEIIKARKDSISHSKIREFLFNNFPSLQRPMKDKEEIRLISSFGKDGLKRGKCNLNFAKSTINVVGNDYTVNMVIRKIADIIGGEKLLLPHPLDPKSLEGVYCKDADVLFIASNDNAENTINTDDYFELDAISKENENRFSTISAQALEESKRWFGIASDFHFRLEEIYSQCMNFEKNNELTHAIAEKIAKVLDIPFENLDLLKVLC